MEEMQNMNNSTGMRPMKQKKHEVGEIFAGQIKKFKKGMWGIYHMKQKTTVYRKKEDVYTQKNKKEQIK